MHFCHSGNQQEISMLTITIKKAGRFQKADLHGDLSRFAGGITIWEKRILLRKIT